MKTFEELEISVLALRNEGKSLAEMYKKNKLDISKVEESRDIIMDTIELIKELIVEDADKFIDIVQGLLTLAVRKIFYDVNNPKVKIEIREGARNSCSIYYIYTDHEGTKIKSDIRKAVGGGVRAVIGFILQTFFISYYKKDRIIFADEAFKEISKSYRPYFIEFLKELCEKHNFKILLISHDEDLIQEADYVYKMENGVLYQS